MARSTVIKELNSGCEGQFVLIFKPGGDFGRLYETAVGAGNLIDCPVALLIPYTNGTEYKRGWENHRDKEVLDGLGFEDHPLSRQAAQAAKFWAQWKQKGCKARVAIASQQPLLEGGESNGADPHLFDVSASQMRSTLPMKAQSWKPGMHGWEEGRRTTMRLILRHPQTQPLSWVSNCMLRLRNLGNKAKIMQVSMCCDP
jgi:hypothetical protein